MHQSQCVERENGKQNLPSVGDSSVSGSILTLTPTDPYLEYLHVMWALKSFAKVTGCPGASQCAVLEKSKWSGFDPSCIVPQPSSGISNSTKVSLNAVAVQLGSLRCISWGTRSGFFVRFTSIRICVDKQVKTVPKPSVTKIEEKINDFSWSRHPHKLFCFLYTKQEKA